MKKLALLLLITLPGYSQLKHSPSDTTFIMNLLKKGESVERKNTATALSYYRKAYDFSKKTNYTKGYFESMRLLAYTLNNLGRHDEAGAVAQAAVQKARQDTSKRNLGLSYFAVANTALYAGNFERAIPNYQKAAHFMRSIGNKANVAVVNQNLGYIYSRQHMYDKALEYYKKALAYDSTDKDDPRTVAVDYFSIGNVLDSQEKIAESRKYYKKALEYVDQENDYDLMVNLNGNMGSQYTREAKYDSAIYHQREAIRLSRELGNPRHELHTLMMLAQTYNRMGKYGQATQLLDESYAIALENQVGLDEFRNIYAEYAIATESLGKHKAAVKWLNQYIDTNDSLNNQLTKELLQEYEVKLKEAESRQKLAEKQQHIDRLQLANQRQNFWILLTTLVGLVVISGLLFAYLYTRQRRRAADSALLAAQRERELAVVQSELQGQQKERLRISKEMHDDLGASLTAIGLLSEVVKSRMGANTTPEIEKISSISADMVTSMNEIIWSLNNKNDSLNGLIAYTRSYASEFIENTTLTLKTEVDELPYEVFMRGTDRRNVFLTVKEALNNVVKHAEATEVRLRICPEADQLRIDVCDNGRGIVPKEGISTRNGLTNMRSRMADVGGNCEISAAERGTCVKITYPYPTVSEAKIMQMEYSE